MNRRGTAAALVCSAAGVTALITGCGGGGGNDNVDVGPAAAVPKNAGLYIDAKVQPTGAAEAGAKAGLSKVMDTQDPGGKIVSLLEQSAKSEGHPVSFATDIQPWLGEDVGVFFSSFAEDSSGDTNAAVVVETKDPQAALAFAQKSSGVSATNPAPTSYNGSSYQADPTDPGNVFGTVGDFLVEGPVTDFKAVVDAEAGDSLGDSSEFKDSLDAQPDNSIASIYTVPRDLIDAIPQGEIDSGTRNLIQSNGGDNLDKPISGFLTASADSFDLEVTAPGGGNDTPQSSLLSAVPSNAWLALGLGNIGDIGKNVLDQLKGANIPDLNLDQIESGVQQATGSSLDDLLSSLGDSALYVTGNSEPSLGGALIVQSKNTELTNRLLGQLQALLQAGSGGGRQVTPLKLSGGGTGIELTSPADFPQPVDIAQQGDKIVFGYGANSAQQALQGGQTLATNPTFKAAEGQVSDLGTDFFLDLGTVFQLVESTGATKDPGYVQAKPYLDALSYVVSGSGSKGGSSEAKFVLGLK